MAHYSNEQHNTLPRKNVEWTEAIVKWTRYDHVAMYDYPTTNNSDAVKEVFKGDTVQVSRRYRREDWCLCRIGHVLGWVFLQDVRFIVQGASAPRPKQRNRRTQSVPVVAQPEQMPTPLSRIKQDVSEVETQPYTHGEQVARPIPHVKQDVSEVETQPYTHIEAPEPLPFEPEPVVQAVQHEKKPLIQRLIKFFKK